MTEPIIKMPAGFVKQGRGKKTSRPKSARFLEAPPRFELGVRILQTLALPLGYGARFLKLFQKGAWDTLLFEIWSE